MTSLLYVFAACAAFDSETLRCGDERVRLARIGTPELRAAGYREAKDAMRLLIKGKEVRCMVSGRDKYHRLLGECSADATPNLGDAMLTRDLAKPCWRRH